MLIITTFTLEAAAGTRWTLLELFRFFFTKDAIDITLTDSILSYFNGNAVLFDGIHDATGDNKEENGEANVNRVVCRNEIVFEGTNGDLGH